MAQASEDDSFHQRLLLRAAEAKQAGGQLDSTVWRQAFDEAVESRGFIPYAEAGGYVSGIGEVVDSVEALLAKGHAEAVIGLSEYGLEAIEEALENVDDSNGEMGSLLDRLQELHIAACRQAAPDPEDLARRLFEWELTGEGYVFHGAAASYAEVLGERGLTLYRRLAEAEWKKLPALAPGDDDPERYGKRYRITSIMETLAGLSGDLEALVEIKSRDLSLPQGFLEIAMLYKEAGHADRALDWSERGWRAFADGPRPDERLREFLADAYHDRDRHDEAMALIWEAFAGRPDFQSYRNLRGHATRSGNWPVWRDKALSHIRERISATIRKQPTRRQDFIAWAPSWSDRSALVEIFLWERNANAAWREAKEGGCSRELWLRLAKGREKAHPLDALAIYREDIPKLLEQTNDRAYREAMDLLHKVRRLFTALEQAEDFSRYMAGLRAAYRRKRNFIKLLDQAGW